MNEPQPFTCSLSPEEAPARTVQVKRLTQSLHAREQDGREVRLRFDPEVEPDVRAFVDDEARCCGFFDFVFTADDDVVELRVRAPAGAEPLLSSLFAAFHPAAPEGGSGDG